MPLLQQSGIDLFSLVRFTCFLFLQGKTETIPEPKNPKVHFVFFLFQDNMSANILMVSKESVLRLYKDLLRYSRQLKFTDTQYYQTRIRNEFRQNQSLTNSKDIEYYFNVCIFFKVHFLISENGF